MKPKIYFCERLELIMALLTWQTQYDVLNSTLFLHDCRFKMVSFPLKTFVLLTATVVFAAAGIAPSRTEKTDQAYGN